MEVKVCRSNSKQIYSGAKNMLVVTKVTTYVEYLVFQCTVAI